jgi:hypothetical protein
MALDLRHVLRQFTPCDKLHLLRKLAVKDADAVEAILDDAIQHRWPKPIPPWLRTEIRVRAIPLRMAAVSRRR